LAMGGDVRDRLGVGMWRGAHPYPPLLRRWGCRSSGTSSSTTSSAFSTAAARTSARQKSTGPNRTSGIRPRTRAGPIRTSVGPPRTRAGPCPSAAPLPAIRRDPSRRLLHFSGLLGGVRGRWVGLCVCWVGRGEGVRLQPSRLQYTSNRVAPGVFAARRRIRIESAARAGCCHFGLTWSNLTLRASLRPPPPRGGCWHPGRTGWIESASPATAECSICSPEGLETFDQGPPKESPDTGSQMPFFASVFIVIGPGPR
jgi:hypothetical protein